MFHRILTKKISSIDVFIEDPYEMLKNVEEGALAILIKNTPAFYVITQERLAQLLEIEARSLLPQNDVTLDNQFFEENSPNNFLTVPIGKFPMYSGWNPGSDFQRIAASWGILLRYPVTSEEVTSFTDYWKVEGKVFYHVQWQQKLARNVQIWRINRNSYCNRDINIFSEPDKEIPHGFRGAK